MGIVKITIKICLALLILYATALLIDTNFAILGDVLSESGGILKSLNDSQKQVLLLVVMFLGIVALNELQKDG